MQFATANSWLLANQLTDNRYNMIASQAKRQPHAPSLLGMTTCAIDGSIMRPVPIFRSVTAAGVSTHATCAQHSSPAKGVDPDTKVGGGDRIHVNPERSFGGTNGEPPSEASQLRKGGPGVLPRKI